MSELINVGDWVVVTSYNGHTDHHLVGHQGDVVDRHGDEIKVMWPKDSEPHKRLYTRYSWFRPNEVHLSEAPGADTTDSGLREAIRTLPGLDNANLVWNTETDPVEFLNKYGEVLGDMLKYYKKKEAKLEKISEALEVLYDV